MLPADLKNFQTPLKLDIKKLGETIGNAIGFLVALAVFVIILLSIILAAASAPVPKQLQIPADNNTVSEVRI